MPASRSDTITAAARYFDTGGYTNDLAELVAVESDSRSGAHGAQLNAYLADHLVPRLTDMEFDCTIHESPGTTGAPILVAARIEDPRRPTVLCYGHGDVTPGMDDRWRPGLSPFRLTVEKDRIYGRGTADNKGQHLVNIAAAGMLLQVQGKLGFNLKFLIEMGEETGSPGLGDFIADNRALLAADVLIASDGPRLHADVPTIFTGARGCINFELVAELREDARHSGNWGGVLADPAILLANAIAAICDRDGQMRVPGWRPDSLGPDIRAALAALPDIDSPDDPPIDRDWGEAELTPAERLFGWNAFSVLAMQSGSVASPDNAIQPRARAVCQLRFVVGTDPDDILPALRRHLVAAGFGAVEVRGRAEPLFGATRTDPSNPWVTLVRNSVHDTTGKQAHFLPNLGGSIPNEFFADTLGLPTIWIPHSYRGCGQHAPDEHNLAAVLRDGLKIMTGLFWDIGQRD